MPPDRLESERLVLRRWKQSDRDPWAEMTADPRVMEFFPGVLTRAEADAFIDRVEAFFLEDGFQFWACERKADAKFIGFVGLMRPRFEAHFTPCVEIGWRLAHHAWGQGFATEGARRALKFGFEELKVPEIVAITAVPNKRSIHVMEKLGMTTNPAENFLHPRVPAGHWLSEHVLYRLKREDFSGKSK